MCSARSFGLHRGKRNQTFGIGLVAPLKCNDDDDDDNVMTPIYHRNKYANRLLHISIAILAFSFLK
jgi:hypothetical protein